MRLWPFDKVGSPSLPRLVVRLVAAPRTSLWPRLPPAATPRQDTSSSRPPCEAFAAAVIPFLFPDADPLPTAACLRLCRPAKDALGLTFYWCLFRSDLILSWNEK